MVSKLCSGTFRGGGGTLLQEAIGDVRLDGLHFHDWSDYNRVAFSIELLEWVRKFSDFWRKYGFKMGRFSVKKIRKLLLNY